MERKGRASGLLRIKVPTKDMIQDKGKLYKRILVDNLK